MSDHEEKLGEEIPVEEDERTENGGETRWSEEFVVAGEELLATVKNLIHETNVRRIVVRNEARRINLEVPLVLGVAGIALLPAYTAVALIAALVTDCQILVERVEKEPEAATES